MRRELILADLLGAACPAVTLPMVIDNHGRLVLVLLHELPVRQITEAVALQQALGRGVLVVCT